MLSRKQACLAVAAVVLTSFALTGCSGSNDSSAGANTVTISTNTDEAPTKTLYNLSEEYPNLSSDNVFIVADAEKTFKFMENGTGVLMLGYKECPWCQEYIPMLDEYAKSVGIKKMIYYDVRKSRLEDPDSYEKLLKLLDEQGAFTEFNDDGEKRIFVPFMATIDHGKITFSNNDTSHLDSDVIEPAQYWTEEMKRQWRERVSSALMDAKSNMDKCQECSD